MGTLLVEIRRRIIALTRERADCYWAGLVPDHIADKQERWEHLRRVHRARAAGASLADIARHLGVSRQLVHYTLKRCPSQFSPVECWLAQQESEDLAALRNSGGGVAQTELRRRVFEQVRKNLAQYDDRMKELVAAGCLPFSNREWRTRVRYEAMHSEGNG